MEMNVKIKSVKNDVEILHTKTLKRYQSIEEAIKEIAPEEEVIVTNNIIAELYLYANPYRLSLFDLKVSLETPTGDLKTKKLTYGPLLDYEESIQQLSYTASVKTTLSNIVKATFNVVAELQQKAPEGLLGKIIRKLSELFKININLNTVLATDSSSEPVTAYWIADQKTNVKNKDENNTENQNQKAEKLVKDKTKKTQKTS